MIARQWTKVRQSLEATCSERPVNAVAAVQGPDLV